MSSNPLNTNGATLESCHTNVFTLTELNGLQWKRFVSHGETNLDQSGDGFLRDPVIVSYGNCLNANLLAAWKRLPYNSQPAGWPAVASVPNGAILKPRLWIFWYGEEHPDLSSVLSPDLSEEERGGWDTGLPYECRTLLFRAIHTLIERCLLARRYVRIGRWFVEPLDERRQNDEQASPRYSYAFDFFLHGESTVCTTVDVRLHQQLVRLDKNRFSRIFECHQESRSSLSPEVILCPYGLAGTLTGQCASAEKAKDLLKQWRTFFPFSSVSTRAPGSSGLHPDAGPSPADLSAPSPAPETPNPQSTGSIYDRALEETLFVEIIVAGIRMFYPSHYVLLVDNGKSQESGDGASDDPKASRSQRKMDIPTTFTPAYQRSGFSGTPRSQEINSLNEMQSIMGCLFRDTTCKDKRTLRNALADDAPARAIEMLSIADISDPGSSKICECDGCRNSFDYVTVRPASPTSSPPPPSYSAQGLGLIAMKVKAAQEQPAAVVEVNRNAPNVPFHKRGGPSANSDVPSQQREIVTAKRSVPQMTSKGAGIRKQTQSSLLSPGPVPKTPQSHLNSVSQVSPVSSPASVSASVNLMSPVTPFNPKTPKTPRSNLAKPEVPIPNWPSIEQKHSVETPANPDAIEISVVPQTQNLLRSGRPVIDAPFYDDSNDAELECSLDTDWEVVRLPKRVKMDFVSPVAEVPDVIVLSSQDEAPLSVAARMSDEPSMIQRQERNDEITIIGSNLLPPAANDDIKPTKISSGTMSLQDLSRMFPTPPSIEIVPVSSPMCEMMPLHPEQHVAVVAEDVHMAAIDEKNVGVVSKYSAVKDFRLNPTILEPMHTYRPAWVIVPKFQHAFRREMRPAARTPRPRMPERQSSQIMEPRLNMQPVFRPPMFPSMIDASPKIRPPPSVEMVHMNQKSMLSPAVSAPNVAVDQFDGNASPECHSLLLNLMLADSLLNTFADKNFVSCSICVCNMSITGRDFYSGPMGEEYPNCTCGFSAHENRKFSRMAGLFLEDEIEITGAVRDSDSSSSVTRFLELRSLSSEQESILNRSPDALVALVKYIVSNPFLSDNSLLSHSVRRHFDDLMLEHRGRDAREMEYLIMNDICSSIIGGCVAVLDPAIRESSMLGKSPSLHGWLTGGRTIRTNFNVLQMQRQLQPLLQEAIQLRRQTKLWEKIFSVEGPLTWKDFLKAVDKDVMDQQKDPLPVSHLLVGLEKEWVKISPLALSYWERLNLEPYAAKRDIAYAVLAPDVAQLHPTMRSFFRELSKTYEACLLGRHLPIPKLPDGILPVTSRNATIPLDSLDEWFRLLGDSPLAGRLRLYGSTCRNQLGPHIVHQLTEGAVKNMFAPPPPPPIRPIPEGQSADGQNIEPRPQQQQPYDYNNTNVGNHMLTLTLPHYPYDPGYPDNDDEPPLIVVYIIDPFAQVSRSSALYRLCSSGLLRSFQELLKTVPAELQDRIVPFFIPLQTVLDNSLHHSSAESHDVLRSLAFSVYSQNLRSVKIRSPTKMLTGFGPATALKRWQEEKPSVDGSAVRFTEMQAFNPPFVLAPRKERTHEVAECMSAEGRDKTTSLFVSYCLSENRKHILVSCTDENGELLETQIINIALPEKSRRKHGMIRFGLKKLWEFILNVLSKLTSSCRLVIGRVGRIGHGELKAWSSLLTKKALSRAGQQFRQLCNQCKVLGALEIPNIVSACLVSLQPESSLRICVDGFTHDERIPSNATTCFLSSPEEASLTHIYVFPTSATAQAHSAVSAQVGEAEDLFGFGGDIDMGLNEQGGDQGVEGLDFSDIDLFGSFADGDQSAAVSPKPGDLHAQSSSPSAASKVVDSRVGGKEQDPLDEPGQLQLQPLAAGYLVSTAPIGDMPQWFYAATEQDSSSCPAILRSALHIHSANVLQGDDMYHSTSSSNRNGHPLDSNLTADVLKYVLESYNALSWLVIDPASRDRRSCLPVHIQVLMQLYFAASHVL